MISVPDAFRKFKSKLELTDKERTDASRRQRDIREHLNESFDIEHDFLTGSYARWTKTKPLKDVDIFCVLGPDESHYRKKSPGVVLNAFEDALAKKYGTKCVSKQRRSVVVELSESGDDEERVFSIDVVPAFAQGTHYEIPDTSTPGGWTATDPRVHYDKAVEANEAYGGEWKALVRMIKTWNNVDLPPSTLPGLGS